MNNVGRKVINHLVEISSKNEVGYVGRETVNWLIEATNTGAQSEVSDGGRKEVDRLVEGKAGG